MVTTRPISAAATATIDVALVDSLLSVVVEVSMVSNVAWVACSVALIILHLIQMVIICSSSVAFVR